jgi:hypothetical protein
MATTTNYGWTTPDDTSLVKDGAAAIRTLGSSVDTTTKNLNPSTTLGDIEYRSSTANTNTRLGIGSDGQVLTVAGGVPSWATAAAGAAMQVAETTATYLKTATGTAAANGEITAVVNRTEYSPVYLPTASFDRISIATASGFSGTASVRLGLYNVSATTGKPSTVVFDAGTVSCTAASTTYEITISQSITAGWYYLAANMQTAASTPSFVSFGGGVINGLIAGSTNFTNTNTSGFFRETGITGAFATAGTLSATTIAIFTGMRLV